MADDTEEMQENDVPIVDTSQQEEEQGQQQAPIVPPQQPLAGPTPPPTAFPQQPTMPAGSPQVPFTIGRRDPVTGQMTTVTGFGQRATPPDQNAQFWNRLRQRTANLPLAQTEAAVSAAMRFQGIRQYQRDLQSGMAQNEALARAAPLIFNAPRQSSLGQAAQFMRASRAPAARVRDVGGVLYRENPQGGWEPITQAKPATPKVNPFDNEEYRSILTEMRQINKDLGDEQPTSKRAQDLVARKRMLAGSLQEIRRRGQSPTTTTGTSGRNEVIRYTRNGRKAVFDAQTRKFLRYAQ